MKVLKFFQKSIIQDPRRLYSYQEYYDVSNYLWIVSTVLPVPCDHTQISRRRVLTYKSTFSVSLLQTCILIKLFCTVPPDTRPDVVSNSVSAHPHQEKPPGTICAKWCQVTDIVSYHATRGYSFNNYHYKMYMTVCIREATDNLYQLLLL